jgi:flagellar motor switch protein FliM
MSDETALRSSKAEPGPDEVVLYTPQGVRRVAAAALVEAYNFRKPGFLSPKDSNQYSSLHQRYAQNLAARLATFLRLEITCERTSVQCDSMSFRAFCDSVTQPTHLTVFQYDGLDGAGVLEVRPKTSVALANRLLGGQGSLTDAERNPTEIEVALLDELVVLILKEWLDTFEGVKAGPPRILAHETGCRFLQIASDDCAFFVFKAELKMGELAEQFQLAVPFALVEQVAGKGSSPVARQVAESRQRPLHWRAPYAAIEVPITAEWQVRTVTVGEAAAISVGDLIQLPQELIDQTRVKVSEGDEFFGTIGVENGRLAVHLNDRIPKE